MTSDEWQAHVTTEAARAIGEWLEGRGRLHHPIAALTLQELEAMAETAIARFVVLGSERIAGGSAGADLTRFLLRSSPAPCADARPAASATSTTCGSTATPSTASARWPARPLAAPSP